MSMPHEDPALCAEMLEMKHAVEAIGRKMDALSGTMAKHIIEEERNGPLLEEIILAWQQGIGILKFVKMMAAVATVLGAIAIFLHDKIVWR